MHILVFPCIGHIGVSRRSFFVVSHNKTTQNLVSGSIRRTKNTEMVNNCEIMKPAPLNETRFLSLCIRSSFVNHNHSLASRVPFILVTPSPNGTVFFFFFLIVQHGDRQNRSLSITWGQWGRSHHRSAMDFLSPACPSLSRRVGSLKYLMYS
jgi:hypothetical protein